jgi:hypothetical protein
MGAGTSTTIHTPTRKIELPEDLSIPETEAFVFLTIASEDIKKLFFLCHEYALLMVASAIESRPTEYNKEDEQWREILVQFYNRVIACMCDATIARTKKKEVLKLFNDIQKSFDILNTRMPLFSNPNPFGKNRCKGFLGQCFDISNQRFQFPNPDDVVKGPWVIDEKSTIDFLNGLWKKQHGIETTSADDEVEEKDVEEDSP